MGSTCLMFEKQLSLRLERLYGAENSENLLQSILEIIHFHKNQITEKPSKTAWDEQDVVMIAYGDTLQSPIEMPLASLKRFADQYLKDAISCIHILPFFPYSSDDGFSVIDYRQVNPSLGNWQNVQQLNEHFELMFDLVLNHCSRENLWFLDFIAHQAPGKDFFITLDPNTNLSQVVRPRSSDLLTEVRTREDTRYVWTTFSHDQVDLNYANPAVLEAFLDILLFYCRMGARIIRLDAVAFLWKELGTSCIHLEQTHEVVKLFRDIVQEVQPEVLLLTETNVPHEENISYFGEGDEAHAVYQFSLPPLLLHAIYSGDPIHLSNWLRNLSAPPSACTYLNFTASHDGVGLRPLEGLVPREEVDDMLQAMRERGGFISSRRNQEGGVTPYELNISYFDAFREHRSQHDRWQMERFFLSQTFALSLKGIPAVYIHSLFATPNDLLGVEQTEMTRSINRRKWDLGELEGLLQGKRSYQGQVFERYIELLALRRQQPAFHPDGKQSVLKLQSPLMGILRESAKADGQCIFCLFNFSSYNKTVFIQELPCEQPSLLLELISGEAPKVDNGELIVPPYGAMWLAAP